MRRNTIQVTVAFLMVITLAATIIPNSPSAAASTKLEKETVFSYPKAAKAEPPDGLWTDAPYTVPAPLKTAPGFKDGMHAPSTTGTLKALVLMIKFTDVSNDPARDATYFNTMLFSTTNPGSMRNYYLENSYGQTTITGYVHPVWLTSSKTMSWYGADSGPYPQIDDANGNIYELAREAVQLADPAIDFSQYDTDSDSVVDHLIIIHAGPDQADYYPQYPEYIWSHRWMIQPPQSADGVVAEGYTMQAETCPMGVFAHEFGHDLGLPDLYDRDLTSWGVGYWCLMGYGSNLGSPSGTCPAHLSAWCKYKLGWITPITITAATIGATLNQIETSATQSVYKLPITTGSDVEYFLIENRQKAGFDLSLPGSGVLIWHIDERQYLGMGQALQNDDENHKLVDLEEADGLNDLDQYVAPYNPGDATDPWYSNPTGFTGTSNPNSNSYSGALTEIKVKNISPSTATMTVDFEATQGWTQIAYDDGFPEEGWAWAASGGMFAVRFTASASGQLKTASFFIDSEPAAFKVHVLDASRNDLISPLTRTPTSAGWFDVDLSAQSITITTGVDFYIGLESTVAHRPHLGDDQSSPDGRSWDWDGSSWAPWADGDYMIRAVVTGVPQFDFSLSSSGGITVTQGGSGSNTITVTLVSGSTQTVSLSASGLPAGSTASFNPTSGSPTFSSTCTISTSSTTPTGSYTITATGTGGGKTHNTTFTLTVNPSTFGATVTTIFTNSSYTLGFMATGNIYDDSGIGFMYAHRAPPKVLFTKTDTTRVLATGQPTWLDYTHLVTVGGRNANPTTKYYEDLGLAPIRFEANATHYRFLKAGVVQYAVLKTSITSSNDYFVMEVAKDGTHTIIILWGVEQYGTYASGIFFDGKYYDLGSLSQGWYIVNVHGTYPYPYPGSFTVVASG